MKYFSIESLIYNGPALNVNVREVSKQFDTARKENPLAYMTINKRGKVVIKK